VVAPAIKKAALQLKAAILDHARKMTGKAAEGLDIVDGNVVNANRPERVVTSLAELAIDAYYHKQRGGQLTADVSHKTRTNAPSFGCTFVDLEVDIPMCKVRVHQILNVHDAGTIIHPLLAEGQVHGGMGMAVGMALYEELLTNPENGRVLNNNLLDYKIPTCVDTPDLGCAFVETTEPTGAYGNKSLGEPPVISPGPAIRNAILDATGVAVNRMPMSPKALFTHFHDAGLI
jgi:xanthine dehydrogenase molybdenum-binding subunit